MREPQHDARADGLHHVAEQDDAAAVVAVGGVAGGEHAEDAGQKEREAGEAKLQRRVCDLVDLPGDRHGLRLGAKDGHQPRDLVEPEVTRTKRVRRAQLRSTVTLSHIYLCCHTLAAKGVRGCARARSGRRTFVSNLRWRNDPPADSEEH